MALTFELLILAKNESQKGLTDAERDYKKFLGEIEGSTSRANTAIARTGQTMSAELAQGSRVVRVIAGDLVSSLNPALGQTVSGLSAATAATRGMGLATGLLVGGLAVAGTTLAQYARLAADTVEKQAALNLAVRSFDAGSIRQQIAAASRDLEINRIGANASKLSWAGFMAEVRGAAEILGLVKRPIEELTRAQEGLRRVLPVERELQLAEAYQKQQAALGPLLQVELQRAERTADLEEFLDIHQRLARAIAAETCAAREAAQVQARIAEARPGITQDEIANIREQLKLTTDLIATQAVGRTKALEAQRDLGALDIRGRRIGGPTTFTESVEEAARRLAGPTGAGDAEQTRRAILETDERRLQLAMELKQTQIEQAGTLLNIEGLSLRQREALELTVASARERLRLAQAQDEIERAALSGDQRRIDISQAKRDVIELEEAIRRSNLGQGQAERTDLFAGISKGFRDMQDNLESFGREGERIVRSFASTAHGFFSDLLFTPLEDDWEKALKDTPRRLLQGIGREITDAVARFTVGNLLKGAQSLFPSVAGVAAAAGLVGAPGVAQGAPSAFQGLQLLQQVGTLGTGAQSTSGGLAGALSGIPVSSLLQLAQSGSPSAAALLASAELFAASPDLGLVAGAAGGPGGVGGAGLGALLGSALGVVGGAAGLGFTIFGALQQNPTPTSIAVSAVSGAVSGAALAASAAALAAALGLAAPTFGVSLAIGAIAGAALGAGAGAAGKGEGPEGARRDRDRGLTGNRIYNEMAAAINSGGSPEQIARTPLHTVNSVGGLLRRIAEYNITGFVAGDPWRWPPEPVSQQAIDILAAIGVPSEEYSEGPIGSVGELIATFGEGDANRGAQRAADLISTFVQLAGQSEEAIEQAAQNTPFAVVEQGTVAGIGQVGVRTFLPFSRIGEAAGRNIELNRDFFRNMDPSIVQALIARVNEFFGESGQTFVDRRKFSGEI